MDRPGQWLYAADRGGRVSGYATMDLRTRYLWITSMKIPPLLRNTY